VLCVPFCTSVLPSMFKRKLLRPRALRMRKALQQVFLDDALLHRKAAARLTVLEESIPPERRYNPESGDTSGHGCCATDDEGEVVCFSDREVLANADVVYRVVWTDGSETYQLENELDGCAGLLLRFLQSLHVPKLEYPLPLLQLISSGSIQYGASAGLDCFKISIEFVLGPLLDLQKFQTFRYYEGYLQSRGYKLQRLDQSERERLLQLHGVFFLLSMDHCRVFDSQRGEIFDGGELVSVEHLGSFRKAYRLIKKA
jgi:hypothetical protein